LTMFSSDYPHSATILLRRHMNGGTSEGSRGWRRRRRSSCFLSQMHVSRIPSQWRSRKFCFHPGCVFVRQEKDGRGIPPKKTYGTAWKSAGERAADAWEQAHGTAAPGASGFTI
jgi:hypothetical protein